MSIPCELERETGGTSKKGHLTSFELLDFATGQDEYDEGNDMLSDKDLVALLASSRVVTYHSNEHDEGTKGSKGDTVVQAIEGTTTTLAEANPQVSVPSTSTEDAAADAVAKEAPDADAADPPSSNKSKKKKKKKAAKSATREEENNTDSAGTLGGTHDTHVYGHYSNDGYYDDPYSILYYENIRKAAFDQLYHTSIAARLLGAAEGAQYYPQVPVPTTTIRPEGSSLGGEDATQSHAPTVYDYYTAGVHPYVYDTSVKHCVVGDYCGSCLQCLSYDPTAEVVVPSSPSQEEDAKIRPPSCEVSGKSDTTVETAATAIPPRHGRKKSKRNKDRRNGSPPKNEPAAQLQ